MGPMKSEYNKRIITLTVITLSGYFYNWNHYLFLLFYRMIQASLTQWWQFLKESSSLLITLRLKFKVQCSKFIVQSSKFKIQSSKCCLPGRFSKGPGGFGLGWAPTNKILYTNPPQGATFVCWPPPNYLPFWVFQTGSLWGVPPGPIFWVAPWLGGGCASMPQAYLFHASFFSQNR